MKKFLIVGIPVFLVLVYGLVLVPLFPSLDEWRRFKVVEDTVKDDHGNEYRRVYRIHRGGDNNGKKHGRFTTYRLDGVINTRGFYNNDAPDGIWTSYDKNGAVRTWTQFLNGQQVRHEVVPFKHSKTIIVPTTFDDRNETPTVSDTGESNAKPSDAGSNETESNETEPGEARD